MNEAEKQAGEKTRPPQEENSEAGVIYINPHAFNERELAGERLQIEFLRACLESAPTYPVTWTKQEGHDYVSAFLNA